MNVAQLFMYFLHTSREMEEALSWIDFFIARKFFQISTLNVVFVPSLSTKNQKNQKKIESWHWSAREEIPSRFTFTESSEKGYFVMNVSLS